MKYNHVQKAGSPALRKQMSVTEECRINLIPFVRLSDYHRVRDILWNVAGNTAMFIPSGIVLPAVYKKLNSFGKTAAAGALISLCIEILQLPFASRVSDIDDLIQNTLGVAAGYGIFAAVKRLQNVILSRSAVEDRQ